MTKSPPNRIAEERKSSGMSQQDLADAVGSHWITISRLERGRMKLTTLWMERLARALNVLPIDLLASTKPIAPAVVSGAVGEDGTLALFPKSEWSKTSVKNTHFNSPGNFWVEVDGRSHEPVLHPGDFIQLIPAPDDDIGRAVLGRLCYLELKKGKGRLGFLYEGSKPGLWDLFWLGGRILKDVRPRSIAVVGTTVHKFRA
jgi:transcriptional regulator with XRE-family HTH domain